MATLTITSFDVEVELPREMSAHVADALAERIIDYLRGGLREVTTTLVGAEDGRSTVEVRGVEIPFPYLKEGMANMMKGLVVDPELKERL